MVEDNDISVAARPSASATKEARSCRTVARARALLRSATARASRFATIPSRAARSVATRVCRSSVRVRSREVAIRSSCSPIRFSSSRLSSRSAKRGRDGRLGGSHPRGDGAQLGRTHSLGSHRPLCLSLQITDPCLDASLIGTRVARGGPREEQCRCKRGHDDRPLNQGSASAPDRARPSRPRCRARGVPSPPRDAAARPTLGSPRR